MFSHSLFALLTALLCLFPVFETGAGEVLNFRLGFVDPANASYPRGGQKFADELEKLTSGRIRVQLVCNGELGGEKEMFEKARAGELEMFSVVNTVLSQYVPGLVLLDIPFLFDNVRQAQRAVDGRLGELIVAQAEEQGVHLLGFLESGFRDIFSNQPIEKLEDFKGIRLRTMENEMQMAVFRSLGAKVFPMPAHEQWEALRAGRIDANENAIGNMLVNRYYELIKHVTNTKHQYTFVIIGFSHQAWQLIPEELKPLVHEAMHKAVVWQRNDLKEINDYAVKELRARGIQFHDIDRVELKSKVVPAIEKLHIRVPQEWLDAYYEALK